MNKIESDLFRAGYVRSPNNIHSLPGSIWYPGSGGLPVPIDGEVQITNDRIRVFRCQFFGKQYSTESYWDTITVAVFSSAFDFIAHYSEHGKLSEPGVSSNSWD